MSIFQAWRELRSEPRSNRDSSATLSSSTSIMTKTPSKVHGGAQQSPRRRLFGDIAMLEPIGIDRSEDQATVVDLGTLKAHDLRKCKKALLLDDDCESIVSRDSASTQEVGNEGYRFGLDGVEALGLVFVEGDSLHSSDGVKPKPVAPVSRAVRKPPPQGRAAPAKKVKAPPAKSSTRGSARKASKPKRKTRKAPVEKKPTKKAPKRAPKAKTDQKRAGAKKTLKRTGRK